MITLLRSFFHFILAEEPDYKIWQCAKLDDGDVGNACQRLKGHYGPHKDDFGRTWKEGV